MLSRSAYRRLGWVTAGFLCLGIIGTGCGGHDGGGDDPPPLTGVGQGGLGGGHVRPTVPCQEPEEGCECDNPGVEEICLIYRESGDYLACYQGTITCGEDGVYGPCEGAVITDLPVPEVL